MLIALFSFFSCSEEEILPTVDDVIGEWQVTSLEYSGKSTTKFLEQSYSIPFNGVGENVDMDFTFTGSPQEFTTFGSYDINLQYEFNGTTVTQEFDGFEFLVPSGEWTLNGKELTLTSTDYEPQKTTVISFNEENLVLQATQITAISEMGVESTYEVTLLFSLKRK